MVLRTPRNSEATAPHRFRACEGALSAGVAWELDILYQRIFVADPGTVTFQRLSPDGPTAYVWELLAIDHERVSWVAHVLERPADPDLAGYLAATLTVEG